MSKGTQLSSVLTKTQENIVKKQLKFIFIMNIKFESLQSIKNVNAICSTGLLSQTANHLRLLYTPLQLICMEADCRSG